MKFILDSGANQHLVGDSEALSSPQRLNPPIVVEIAKGQTEATHGGTIYFKPRNLGRESHVLKLKECLFVPGIGDNLLSLSQLAKDGYKVEISHNRMRLLHRGAVLLSVPATDGMYELSGEYMRQGVRD
jgi:hypothetical protein